MNAEDIRRIAEIKVADACMFRPGDTLIIQETGERVVIKDVEDSATLTVVPYDRWKARWGFWLALWLAISVAFIWGSWLN